MCLLAALDSQGIVVKCTAAIFFRTVDWSCINILQGKKETLSQTWWQANNQIPQFCADFEVKCIQISRPAEKFPEFKNRFPVSFLTLATLL